jgi:DNA-binding CsgD family transcriptional regulator
MPRCFLLVNQAPVLAFADFCLTPGKYVLGRSAECDLPINDETVSRRHAELVVTKTLIQVADLSSRNGTFLDGNRITKGSICGGPIQFGQVRFLLEPREELPEESVPFDEETTDGDLSHAGPKQHHFLRPTQLRVLAYLRQGLSEKELAVKLFISQSTAHHHVQKIYRAFDVHSRAELMAKFINQPGKSKAGL